MTRQKATHWNPEDGRRWKGKTRCGQKLAEVNHSTNPNHATCQACIRWARADGVT